MTNDDSQPQETARPASVADLKLLLTALNTHGVAKKH
jgi:hypothetical protein